MVPQEEKILENYPFEKLNPPIILVEGLGGYDGVIGDEPGAEHKGIDYVLKTGEEYASFHVYATHEGEAFFGESEKGWGTFVNLRKTTPNGKIRFESLYVHLDTVNPKIPKLTPDGTERQYIHLQAGEYLGTAGNTGNTGKYKIIQLHFELQRKDLETNERKVIDPYGVYEKVSSGKYPQPGHLLTGLDHYFSTDNPGLMKLPDLTVRLS